MASPFAIFRKHQKKWLAVIGILTILAFTVLGTAYDRMRIGPSTNPVLATTTYGEFTRYQLLELSDRRRIANNYIRNVIQANLRFELNENYRYFGGYSRQELMDTYLQSELATESGVVVSNDEINLFLMRISNNLLKPSVFLNIARQLDVSQEAVFGALRHEMLANHGAEILFRGFGRNSAVERWRAYQKVNRRVKIEYLAIPVEDYLDRVADPSEDELRQFFDAHKSKVAQPGSPEPGFKIPYRAKFQYVAMNVEKVRDEAAITQREIEEYYEENKDREFLFSSFSSTPPLLDDEQKSGTDKDATDKDGTDKDATDKDGTDKSEEESADKADKQGRDQGTDAKPSGIDQADQEGADAQGSSDKPDETTGKEQEKSSSPESNSPEANSSEEKQSKVIRPSDSKHVVHAAGQRLGDSGQVVLASYQDDEADNKEATSPADGGDTASDPATDSSAGDGKEEDNTETDNKNAPGEEDGTTDTDEGKSDATGGKSKQGPKVELPVTVRPDPIDAVKKYLLPKDINDGPEPKYKPLSTVQDSIRKTIATQKARERIRKVFSELSGRLQRYSARFVRWQFDPDTAKPKVPDMEALAKEQGVPVASTEMVSATEMAVVAQDQENPTLANSIVGRDRNNREIGFIQAAMSQDGAAKMFFPIEANSRDSLTEYLVWKVEEADSRIPEFEEARKDIERVWKIREARKDAEATAKARYDEAASKRTSLADVFGADQIGQTTDFTWFSSSILDPLSMQQSGDFSITQVKGINEPGSDFMEAVFSLKTGESGWAFNNPGTVAYVFRVIESAPSVEQLQSNFLQDRSRSAMMFGTDTSQRVIDQENRELAQEVLREFRQQAKLKWDEKALQDDPDASDEEQ